jgi:uncharacterized protein DUF1707
MATGYNVRVGDADREAIAAQLREHFADGRLTLDELNERLDQTFAAKTKDDLNVVMRDLPHVARPFTDAPAVLGPAGRSGWEYGNDTGYSRQRGRVFAPLMMALVWVALVVGAVMLFGLGGGDRPLAIVLLIAAFGFIKRLFGFAGRRRGSGGPRRGPKGQRRGSRGPRF